ncbi:MAG: GNAT family N-acetyltransferase [Chloroflexi bacterium]|nr:GNAT family N-acetyltransferase [Chloroflexota bacterium]
MANDKREAKVRKMIDDDLERVNEIDDLLFGEKRVRTWPFSFKTYWDIYGPGVNFVAEVGGKVVGFLAGNILAQERSQSILDLMHTIGRTSRYPKIGWIDMMGILPEFQNRQIGRLLVDAFQKECQRHGAPMRAIIRGDDAGLANFLVKSGFRKWETTVYEKD